LPAGIATYSCDECVVSTSGYYAWLVREPSKRTGSDVQLRQCRSKGLR